MEAMIYGGMNNTPLRVIIAASCCPSAVRTVNTDSQRKMTTYCLTRLERYDAVISTRPMTDSKGHSPNRTSAPSLAPSDRSTQLSSRQTPRIAEQKMLTFT